MNLSRRDLVYAAGVLALGATQLRNMPVDVLPEFGPPTVEVQTEALGLSAPEVEQLITVPMEQLRVSATSAYRRSSKSFRTITARCFGDSWPTAWSTIWQISFLWISRSGCAAGERRLTCSSTKRGRVRRRHAKASRVAIL